MSQPYGGMHVARSEESSAQLEPPGTCEITKLGWKLPKLLYKLTTKILDLSPLGLFGQAENLFQEGEDRKSH